VLIDDPVLRKICEDYKGIRRSICNDLMVLFEHITSTKNFTKEALSKGYSVEATGTQVYIHNRFERY
jgi:hypothetical protein